METGNYPLKASGCSVTVKSSDSDLANLLGYLSCFPLVRQLQLLNRAERWIGLASPGGFTGADSASLDLLPASTGQPCPLRPE